MSTLNPKAISVSMQNERSGLDQEVYAGQSHQTSTRMPNPTSTSAMPPRPSWPAPQRSQQSVQPTASLWAEDRSQDASAEDPPFSHAPPRPVPRAQSHQPSFLTPKKNRPAKPPPSEPSTPSRGPSRAVDASPFGPHYQKTGSITVEPYLAPAPSSGPWTPAKSRRWQADDDDVFGSTGQWGDGPAEPQGVVDDSDEEEERSQITHVTLSQLLDNVVILEESIKELVAIIHARRSLGIDSIRYL
ncbi:hypothetical protein NUW54_g3103 [Trametes sanguinea]|uniref:Uncharacterized protein n=1 Tax=Trametes sanguinea TaxID=158606 RepID=A0ACC1Q1P3_9APHY|nr:hypothetical protein NUW54_g3103 [Trametes sanguinea]